jgi:UDP-N-acetylmuramate dehydrogenase
MVDYKTPSDIVYSVSNLRKLNQKINIPISYTTKEPLKHHTHFEIGGPADYFCTPCSREEVVMITDFCRQENIPLFFLGEGANVLVSDAGVRGVVVDLKGVNGFTINEQGLLAAETGARVTELAEYAADRGFSGIEFFYSMPGTVGGALYMNARCYGISTSDVLTHAVYIDQEMQIGEITPTSEDFGYKKSPFMTHCWTILEGAFQLNRGNRDAIWETMKSYKTDRTHKGHFTLPSVGSVFKNNRDFGEPTGKIIDSLGLKGYRIGDAQVSLEHANIIVNIGNARAVDVKKLIEVIKDKVFKAYGYILEEEVRYIGEW